MTTSSSSSGSGRSSLLSSKRRLSSLDDQHQQQAPKRTPTPDPQPSCYYPEMDLATFLWQTPFRFQYSFNDTAKRTLIRKCYTTLWKDQDAVMEQYFFSHRAGLHDAIDRLMLHRHHRTHNLEGLAAAEAVDLGQQTVFTAPAQRCGRVFRKGEPVYRCRDCGLDDTCVLCSKCFHASSHENHNVLVAISPGSGGCCDCGDPEAWKIPLECGMHGTTTPNSQGTASAGTSTGASSHTIPPHILKHVRQTIVTVMDFILVTFALASEDISIPASNADIVQANQSECAIFRRMGVPARRPLKTTKRSMPASEDPPAAPGEDVNMNKENQVDDDDQLYMLIAWNDETHSFKDVCESIMRAIPCSDDKARRHVETIHTQGRDVIGTSTNLDELRTMAAPLTAIGLGVTIRPARDVIREQVTTVLVDWLRDLAQNHQLQQHETIQRMHVHVRTIICEELCAKWKLPKQIAILTGGTPSFRMMSEDEDEDDADAYHDTHHHHQHGEDGADGLEQHAQEHTDAQGEAMMVGLEAAAAAEDEDVDMDGGADDDEPPPTDSVVPMVVETDQAGKILYQTEKDIASIDWNPAWLVKDHRHFQVEEQAFAAMLGLPTRQDIRDMKETRLLAFAVQREFEQKQRLDYFLLYDQRVWKELRVSLREFYILTLGSHPVYKKRFGKRLVRNYARLVEAFLFRDREPENAIILFSVQLLTVPSVCSLLVNEYYFFGLVCNTLSVFFMTEEICYMPVNKQQGQPRRLSCESRAFRTRRYFNAFHDLRYILHVELLKPVIAHDAVFQREFLELISLFQAMNPQTCQKDTHVEYESEVWVNAFNVTLQIAKCCRSFSDCYRALPTATQPDRIHTAQILVRAVARVLKAIDDWGAEPIDRARLPLPQVPATRESSMHPIALPYVGELSVIEYDIASAPVSFHHPLHWLLAGILESATWLDGPALAEAGWHDGFFNAIQMYAAEDDDRSNLLLRVLDYPIRTLAFSSQIRAGVWVRNGYNIRNQVHHYRDISLRETTYDSDIFLLQFAFVSIDPNTVLATLMDRFDLVAWFSGDTEQHPQYDHSQVIFMVEEILYLLIVCLSERGNAMHATLKDKMRREIIHHLCLGSSVYSELTKRIPERLSEQADFDATLGEVAHYKAPTSLNDSGRYELRDEYFDAIDPYFWHYSRNNRGEAELVLKERHNKKHKDAGGDADADAFFVRPKPLEPMDGAFKDLYQLLQAPVLVQMLAHTLANVRQMGDAHKSDTVIDEALYLLLMAVSSTAFCDYATERVFGSATLFDILVQYRTDDHAKETHARLDWIFEQMMQHGSDSARQRMRACHALAMQTGDHGDQQQQQPQQQELSEQERKKKAALERQKKIMEMFAQAQSAFMEQNEDLLDDENDDHEDDGGNGIGDDDDDNGGATGAGPRQNVKVHAYPTGTCIVCQEDVNERSLSYGMLGLVQVSNVLREADLNNRAMLDEMDQMGPNLDRAWPSHEVSDRCGRFPAEQHKSGLCATTCGHLMHIKCFETYNASIDPRHAAQLTRNHPENRLRKEFTCPLCKSLGNMLLPIIWKGKPQHDTTTLLATATEDAYSRFLQSELHMAAERLQTAIDPSRPLGFGVWSAGGDMLFAPRLPSLKGMRLDPPGAVSADAGDGSGGGGGGGGGAEVDTIPGLSTLLGVEQQQQRRNRLGPSEMLFKSAVGVIPAIESAYTRLQDVFSVILEACSSDTARSLSASVKYVDTLWGMLGFTISAMEIAARGNEGNHSDDNAVFGQIPMQAQTLLRILCDTTMSYTSLMCSSEHQDLLISSRLFSNTGSGSGPDSRSMVQVHMLAMQRLLQIFASDTATTSRQAAEVPPDTRLFDNPPLLADDPFMVLAELSVHLVHVTKADIHPFVRVLLLAELTKTSVALLQQHPSPDDDDAMVDDDDDNDDDDDRAAQALVALVANAMGLADAAHHHYHRIPRRRLCRMLKAFALPYLRRTVILMVARFGLALDPAHQPLPSADNEFDRLLHLLHLPSLATLIHHPDTDQVVRGWCSQMTKEAERRRASMQDDDNDNDNDSSSSSGVRVALDLPTPFQLISLPARLDTLMDESTRRICPRCETVPTDPAVCLLCGAFVCSQSFCCSEGEEGECNLHMLECGGEIGIYLLIKRCSLLVLHNENGWFMQPPYLDAHGEVDQGLRRGRPQYLNAQRYADTRRLWLQHGIPAYVARQIEATYDVGGWTTL